MTEVVATDGDMRSDASSTEQERARAAASRLAVFAQSDEPWVADAIDRALRDAAARRWHDVRPALMHVQILFASSHHRDVMVLIDRLEREATVRGMRAAQAVSIIDRIGERGRAGLQPDVESFATARAHAPNPVFHRHG